MFLTKPNKDLDGTSTNIQYYYRFVIYATQAPANVQWSSGVSRVRVQNPATTAECHSPHLLPLSCLTTVIYPIKARKAQNNISLFGAVICPFPYHLPVFLQASSAPTGNEG